MITKNFVGGKIVCTWTNGEYNVIQAESLVDALKLIEKAQKDFIAYFDAKPVQNKEKSFKQKLKALSMACMKKSGVSQVLQTVYNQGSEFAACDGYQLFVMSHSEDAPQGMLNAESFKKGVFELDEKTKDSKYPSYQKIIPKSWDHQYMIDCDIKSTVKALKDYAKQFRAKFGTKTHEVVQIKNNQLISRIGGGIICEWTNQYITDIDVCVNPVFLANALDFFGNEAVIKFNNSDKPIGFDSKDKSCYGMIMPIKP